MSHQQAPRRDYFNPHRSFHGLRSEAPLKKNHRPRERDSATPSGPWIAHAARSPPLVDCPAPGQAAMMPPTRAYQAAEALPTTARQASVSLQQQQHQQSHKRKRDSPERNGSSRPKTANGVQGDGGEQNNQLDNLLLGENADFTNLAQQLQQHAANNPTSSTAAAALRQHMPSITIPQPTELSFQSANTVEDDDQGESSFNLAADGHRNHHTEGTPYNLDTFPENSRNPGGAGANKPAVGTEEWHKVRRDNHKEGKTVRPFQSKLPILTGTLQSNEGGAKPSMKASTSSPRSSRAVTRTKAPSSNAASSTSPN